MKNLYVFSLISYLTLTLSPCFVNAACESANSKADQSFVIASDISNSMNQDEINLQSRAYVNAFQNPEIVDKLLGCGCTELSMIFFGRSTHMMIGNLKVVDQNSLKQVQELYQTYIDGGLPHVSLGDPGNTYIANIMKVSINHLARPENTAFTKGILISGDGTDSSEYRTNYEHFASLKEEATYNGITINGVTVNIPTFDDIEPTSELKPVTPYRAEATLTPTSSFTNPVTRFYEAHVITEYGYINEAFSHEDFEPALIKSLEDMVCRPMS